MVGSDHGGQKLADKAKVGEDVHGKDPLERGIGGFKNCQVVADASVVDQDCRMPEGRADGGCSIGDSFVGCDIAGNVVDVRARKRIRILENCNTMFRDSRDSKVGGCISREAILTPFSANKKEIFLPIPSLPPVITAISFSHSYFELCQLF